MKKTILLLTLPILLFACGEGSIDIDAVAPDKNEISDIDKSINNMDLSKSIKIGGKMFSLPSPVQMSLLLKNEIGIFNEEMMSNPEGIVNFSTTYKKAINMGVFGADLGYATIFENSTTALSYLSAVEKLAEDLGIANAFDESLVQRFIDNGNEADSMLVIMSDGYRHGDKFLKNNDQHDVATLILTGGWVESLYFAISSYEQKQTQEIANRIGEQKSALVTIIDLLEGYNTDQFYTDLINELKDLKTDFDNIKFNYQFIEPQTDKENGITYIKSKTAVSIDKETMTNIIVKVKSIRKNLIN